MLGQIYNQNARELGDLNLFGVGETSQEVTLELGVNARLGAEYQGLKYFLTMLASLSGFYGRELRPLQLRKFKRV